MSQRKSVSFQDEATVMEPGDGPKTVNVNGDTDSAAHHGSNGTAGDADQISEKLDDLKLEKKKKKAPKPDAATETTTADGEADFSTLLKKKKKKKKAPVDTDDFEAQVKKAAQQDEKDGPVEPEPAEEGVDIWAHDATQAIPYNMLLSRFFTLLQERHPDLAIGGGKNYKIPPPQCLREGSKKTVFANIHEISQRLKRNDEHVMSFLFAELGTSGSVDASARLILKGRFQQKQIENVLRRYIVEYVSCRTCRSPNTTLSKGENRLNFIECNSCGSRRSVTAIKAGFTAQIGKRKRQVG